MATLWQIITGNSTLPIQAGNTFWDHINNQDGNGGNIIIGNVDLAPKLNLVFEQKVELGTEVVTVNMSTNIIESNLLVERIITGEIEQVKVNELHSKC